eukprot:TRINITY_DN6926_c0_g1_i1.p1 TRINITY_DN6926_c0_g1~~TRINITY_DN6926_c0_g1_i1.p1  ORF type:complete len:343 (-),score=68.99 TRINITY_DN6926_c0_g1_i1:37-1065(-)
MWQSQQTISLDNSECVLGFVPSSSGNVLAGYTSMKAIKIFDPSKASIKESLTGHEKSITGICWQPNSDNVLFSSSLDKTVKMWDLREKNRNVKTFTFQRGGGELFCVGCNGDKVFAGARGNVHSWNVESGAADRTLKTACNDITQVTFRYSDANKLYVASTEGVVTIYDISQEDEDEAFIDAISTEQSISQMGFYGDSNSFLWCLTPTEELNLWNLDNEEQPNVATWKLDLRETLSTKSKLEIFNLIGCSWEQQKSLLYLFAGSLKGEIGVFSVIGKEITHISSLTDTHSDAVKAVCALGDSLWTAGDDDIVGVWKKASSSTVKRQDRKKKKGDKTPYSRKK